MPKISKEIWNQVLTRKVNKMFEDNRKKKQEALDKFQKDNRKVMDHLTNYQKKQAELQDQINHLADQACVVRVNLYHKAIKLGLMEQQDCNCNGYSRCQLQSHSYVRAPKGSQDIHIYDLGLKFKKDCGVGPSNYARVEDFLKITEDPTLKKLWVEFQDLQLKVELSDNEVAQKLIAAFLK